MKQVRVVIDKLYGIRALGKFRPVLDALDAFFFGTEVRTDEAPHIRDSLDIKRYMSFVVIGLIPAAIASVVFFGVRPILIILTSYIAGGAVEVVFAIFRKKEIHEGFLVTGLIFPLTLPPTVPLWVVAVGVIFGTVFGKEVFGGTGRNVFNAALVGRLFVTLAFPEIMTTSWHKPFVDTITSATPLISYKTSSAVTPYLALLLGKEAGSMGETFRLGIILGGVFLMFAKVSNWRIPVSYSGGVFLLALLLNPFFPGKVAPPLFQVLSGGLLFGAMFMATDPVTSPFTMTGKYFFGAGCAFLTVLIRTFSGYVEGVMFSIVLMNALAPLIDHLVLRIRYRRVRR